MVEPISNSVRIVLIVQLTLTRAGLRAMLERVPYFHLVGEASNVQDALKIIAREDPNIILFDSDAADSTDLDAMSALLAAASDARLVLITTKTDANLQERAVELGAMGIVDRSQTADTLIKATISSPKTIFSH